MRHLILATAALLPFASARAGDLTPVQIAFFEKSIRPVLAENCYGCHGPEKQQFSLRLDSRAAMLEGGDLGPVLVPGNPDKSKLVQVLRYAGDKKMPQGKPRLSDSAITDITNWVRQGAPWPETKVPSASISKNAADHWAFRPVREPALPAVADPNWNANPIDRFIFAKLRDKGLSPSPAADRRTLLRRVTFDLIGLPPTPDETDAFVNDQSSDAYEKVVDRLLSSPRYGERWARHWLDVARYADTKGYLFTEDRNYPFAWVYRDWVIQSLNRDMPYDQFIVAQLAADRLNNDADNRDLAALGFLVLGRRFLNNIHDIIDDRLDVTCRGLMGLTLGCARCHDHKYDPIPMADYYSLYGVFASSTEPPPPVLGTKAQRDEFAVKESEFQAREKKLNDFIAETHRKLLDQLRTRLPDYLLAAHATSKFNEEDIMRVVGPDEPIPVFIQRWKRTLESTRRTPNPIFGPWHQLIAVPEPKLPEAVAAFLARVKSEAAYRESLNAHIVKAISDKPPSNRRDLAERYAQVFRQTEELSRGLGRRQPLKDPAHEQIRAAILGRVSPLTCTVEDVRQFLENYSLDRPAHDAYRKLKAETLAGKAPPTPLPRAMILSDSTAPREPYIFLRGNPNNHGEHVPRRFLKVLAGENRKPFSQGSGRLELARAIASPDNPLTARVMVNRVWAWHFGTGLVTTLSDFGTRSDPPSHPELLDWLANRFVADGWSIKSLHRRIVTSATYRQSSGTKDVAAVSAIDADNRLLSRMPHRRHDFETLRDSMLFVSGQLDLSSGGPSLDLFKQPFSKRRSVYGFVDRQNLPGTFRTFDFALPDAHAPQRFTTTVPQQALYLLNSPFVIEQARAFAARTTDAADAARRIERFFRIAYGRSPTSGESAAALAFVHSPPDAAAALPVWEQFAQVLLLSNEFAFAD